MRARPADHSEATSPERRAFILLLGAMSLVFLAVESPAFAEQPGYVLAARLSMSALLLAAPVLLGRGLAPATVRWLVHVLCAGVCLAFGTIAWGTGGTQGPYFAFLPMLPLVFTIAVPDVPTASLLAGACAGGVGLARVFAEGARLPGAAFWVLAFSTTTLYALVGAVFNRRQRERERRLVEEREAAREILAEGELQRARGERRALVGRLAEGVAQDVSAPVSAMAASVGELERHLAAAAGRDPELAARLAGVNAALEGIRRTVGELRSFARADVDASEDCDLAVAMEEARLALEERFRAAVAVSGAVAGLPRVHVARARLVHALVWIMADASGRGVRRLRISARRAGRDVLVDLEGEGGAAPLDLPAAAVGDDGMALALAREDLLRAGCRVEGPMLGLPLRFGCPAARDPAERHPRLSRSA